MALHRFPVLALLAAATLVGGCVYRPDIQQGNLLSVKDIEQVTVGMTRSQVRYLLGTPMVSDPFAPQRWDYVYRMQYGRDRKIDSAHFIVYFDGDRVSRVETLDVLEPPRAMPGSGPQRPASAEKPGSGPTADAPPPDPVPQAPSDGPGPGAG